MDKNNNNYDKKKVLILVNELLLGGAQRIILDISRNINKDEFDLLVVYLKSHDNFGLDVKNLSNDIAEFGVRVIGLNGKKKFTFLEYQKLLDLLKTEKPDVLHTFLPYAGIIGRIAGRFIGIKKIISTQCNLPVAYSFKIYWLDKITLPLAHVWTGATEGIEQLYGGSAALFKRDLWEKGRRHFTIVAGVDLPVFDKTFESVDRKTKRKEIGVPESPILVTMTARMIPWKGHADVVEAMTYLPNNFHLILIGWGVLEGDLKKRVNNLGLGERVNFLGVRNDVTEILAITDIYVQAHSRALDGKIWMGPNTSQMEACAARIPSISTKVPLIDCLIEDGVTGKLSLPNNPKDLARSIKYMVDHHQEAKFMAENARKRVEERYSVDSMVKSYQLLYNI